MRETELELDRVVGALGLEAATGALAEGWSASQALQPPGIPFFLEVPFVQTACAQAGLPAEVVDAATLAARRIVANAALTALAWHCHCCLYRLPAYPRELISRWPFFEPSLGATGDLFYLLVLLSNMAALQASYAAHAIPEGVARDTLYDIQRWKEDRPGVLAMQARRLPWLTNHLTGGIYQLGRLQFQPGRFRGLVRVYRREGSGQVLALSEDGARYRSDGQLDGAGGVSDPESAWTATLASAPDGIHGIPLLPEGRAVPRPVCLAAGPWRPVLAPGDPVLHMHIPAGSPLDFEQCGTSLQAALAFFPRHFPHLPFVAFTCSSWLLDAQFEAIMPASSNIVRFMQELYLLPGRSNGNGTLERVFGAVPENLAEAPRDTTLRRAVLDHLSAGGHFRGGGAFLFPEDFNWGRQVYRQHATLPA